MTALPPKPTHNFYPLRFSPPGAAPPSERRAMIATEAYLLAERRGFVPGHEMADWTAAELEVDTRLAQAQQAGIATW